MNYQTQLQDVNTQIETLTAQLNQLKKEQDILSQLVEMEGKMEELKTNSTNPPLPPHLSLSQI